MTLTARYSVTGQCVKSDFGNKFCFATSANCEAAILVSNIFASSDYSFQDSAYSNTKSLILKSLSLNQDWE